MEDINLFFVLGPSGAGKSTFLSEVQKAMPDSVGLVEVGKMLRARFSPDYFKGSAAPQHTQKLAMELCHTGVIEFALKNPKKIILVDGQPRNPEQAENIQNFYIGKDQPHNMKLQARFLNLFCPTAVRKERLEKRDKDDDAKLALSMSRLEGDLPALYEVLQMIHDKNRDLLFTFNTNNPKYEPVAALRSLLLIPAISPFDRIETNQGKNNVVDTPAS